jgi:diguanylate cyclase (GGDEF)-like protein
MGQAEEGDFLVRAVVKRNDEIGLLAATFNKMLSAITQLKATEIEQAQDLAQAHKELIFQKQLEERNSVIEQTNADLEKRLEELTLLLDLTRSVTSTLELDAVLDEISRRVGQAMGVDEFAILLFDNRGRRLKVVSTFGVPNNVDLTQLQFRLGEGLSGRVAQSGQSIVVNDTAAEPRYLYYKGLRPQDGSFLSVPLIAKGSVIGVLDFFRAQKNSFDEHSVALLTIVAGQAALAIENAKLFAAQSELALTDPLTQLANRRSLEQRLIEEVHRAQRFENTLSLLMIDIDHFKEFNDAHGHLLGDHVLKQVARTLKRHVRTVDTVARYGGEEFCVVLVRTDIQRALAIAEKLRDAVENKTYARIREDRRIKITISLGVATLSPNRSDPTALIDAADQALYAAKNNGRNQVVSAQQQHNEL